MNMDLDAKLIPLLGEIRDMYIDGEIRRMIGNGEKWLSYEDVYPLIYYAQTGRPLDKRKKPDPS
jgi:hypothetical protein